MKTRVLLAISTSMMAAPLGVTGIAQAGGPSGSYQFQSPGGNIACNLGPSGAVCDIGDHTYTPPPTPADCHLGWGDRFSLDQGSAATIQCHGDTLRVPGLTTLDYGQSLSSGSITCADSQSSGVTCTDNSSGHFFRVSSGSYQLS
jgi:hypothetical protein